MVGAGSGWLNQAVTDEASSGAGFMGLFVAAVRGVVKGKIGARERGWVACQPGGNSWPFSLTPALSRWEREKHPPRLVHLPLLGKSSGGGKPARAEAAGTVATHSLPLNLCVHRVSVVQPKAEGPQRRDEHREKGPGVQSAGLESGKSLPAGEPGREPTSRQSSRVQPLNPERDRSPVAARGGATTRPASPSALVLARLLRAGTARAPGSWGGSARPVSESDGLCPECACRGEHRCALPGHCWRLGPRCWRVGRRCCRLRRR